MVRRSAATHLSKFIKVIPKPLVITEMLPLFCNVIFILARLALDDQDSVRLLTVESLITLCEIFTPDECKLHLMTTMRSLYSDKSWRVRYMIADKFVNLSKTVGQEIIAQDLIHAYVSVLKDIEAEVKTAACAQLPGFCKLLGSDTVIAEILPSVRELVTDTSQHVRGALAIHISGLAPIVGKINTIEHLLPLFLQLLKDEASEVRLNIISRLDKVNEGIFLLI
jgi:serine/threonine-protein phosphatase 2A regulatory subunit A